MKELEQFFIFVYKSMILSLLKYFLLATKNKKRALLTYALFHLLLIKTHVKLKRRLDNQVTLIMLSCY